MAAPRIAWPPCSVRLLLSLVVLFVTLQLSLVAQPADGSFRGWQVGDVAPHPNNGVVYVLDYPNYIRAVNRTTGAVLQWSATLTTAQYIVAIAADGLSNRVYALIQSTVEDRNTDYIDYWLVTLTADLHPIANISLATLSPQTTWFDRMFTHTLPIDSKGNVYIARQLNNGTVLVHIFTPDGKQARTWTAPFHTEEQLGYSLALGPGDTLYFQTDYYWWWLYNDDQPRPLHITTTDGVLLASILYDLTSANCEEISAIAVSPTSGNVAVACDSTLLLFDASGVLVPSFRYISTLDSWTGIQSLAFDSIDRLLAVVPTYDIGIQVVSSVSGDLLSVWTNGVPTLSFSQAVVYEPWSQSLVAFRPSSKSIVLRVDADRGTLLQEYSLSARQDNCYSAAAALGATGDLHLLLNCYYFDARYYTTKLLLHSMTPAGRIRREVVLDGWSAGMLQSNQLVVCEDKQLFYVLTNWWDRINTVVAITFNGTNVFNYTDKRIGNIGNWNTQLLRVNDNTLAVVDPDNYRIILLDLDNGAFFGTIPLPQNTLQLGTAYDGNSWYRSEVDWIDRTGWGNSSIRQYATDGSVMAYYSLDGEELGKLSIGGVGDRHRLYAVDRYEGTVAWWNIQSQASEQQTATTGRHSTREQQRLPAAEQPAQSSELFKAAVQVRRQQWMDEMKEQEEKNAPTWLRQMRANRTEKVRR